MFRIEDFMLRSGRLMPLVLFVSILVVGIVVSKLSEWSGNGNEHRR